MTKGSTDRVSFLDNNRFKILLVPPFGYFYYALYRLGSVWLNPLMTLSNVSPVKEVLDEFGVPQNHVVWSTVALGYPEAPGVLVQKNDRVIRFA